MLDLSDSTGEKFLTELAFTRQGSMHYEDIGINSKLICQDYNYLC